MRLGSSPYPRAVLALNRLMDDRWLSVGEIAEYLGVSRDTIYTWIDVKGLPAHRLGRLWKFRREEVDGWVKSGNAADHQDGTN